MNTTIEKSLDYRCFLLGIIIYWMFESIATCLAPYCMILETTLHPIAVIVGKSLLLLLVFYLLFRKARMFHVKWVHLAIFIGVVVLMNLLSAYLSDRFLDLNSLAANQTKWNLSNATVQSVRKWANLVSSLLIIGFVWWRYKSEAAAGDPEISPLESQSYYGGILFTITLGYIFSLIKIIGGDCWTFANHPLLAEVINCLLIILVTIWAIRMLVKRQLVVLSITAIIIIAAIHFFSSHYLMSILANHFTRNHDLWQRVNVFALVGAACGIAFNLAAFILYRKEIGKQNA